jgi:hypothetical protein
MITTVLTSAAVSSKEKHEVQHPVINDNCMCIQTAADTKLNGDTNLPAKLR